MPSLRVLVDAAAVVGLSACLSTPARVGSSSPPPAAAPAPSVAQNNNAWCEQEIRRIHSASGSPEAGARAQRALFTGPCAHHPSAANYVSGADQALREMAARRSGAGSSNSGAAARGGSQQGQNKDLTSWDAPSRGCPPERRDPRSGVCVLK